MKHWARSKFRVRVLEFFQDKVVSKALETAEKLSVYLEEVPNSACKHHLYLVEDFSLNVMEVLGSHFRIDPYIFAAQSSVTYWTNFPRGVGLPRKLFSMQRPTEQFTQFTLRYLEFNVLDEKQQYKIYDKIHDIYTDANLRRKIFFDRLDLDDVFFIRRNSSCWTEKTQEGWDSK